MIDKLFPLTNKYFGNDFVSQEDIQLLKKEINYSFDNLNKEIYKDIIVQ